MPTLEQVRADAAQLSDDDRELLMVELAASLRPQTPEEQEAYDRAWEEEIERRIRDVDEGREQLIPWEEVRASAQQMIDNIRHQQSH
ncbi:MAG TPA: addiction module protein [Tepidiformaceae bacterium]|nr:addiction module protein [Tepidiformaceae bacterium]